MCKGEGTRKRETERLKISKHYSLSKYKSTITQRLINDRQREENDGIHTYTLLPFPEPTVYFTILLAKKLSWVVCFPGVGYFVERLETWITSKPWQRSLHFTCSCGDVRCNSTDVDDR